MEQLGYKFKSDNEQLKKEIEQANICFLHAPMFHPALKTVGPIRRNLGLRTFFNMLGPMVNPADPEYQLVGVYNLEMARIYNYLLQQSGKAFTIIHGLDGYDEISLTNDTKVITQNGEKILTPIELGKRLVEKEDIYGGNTVEESAKIFKKIIKGEGSWAQNAVVFANAAMALHCTGNYKTYDDAYHTAVESLESGKAYQSLQTINQFTVMNILDKIVADKKKEVALKKSIIPVEAWKRMPFYNDKIISLKNSLLEENSTGIIAEFKRKSPSKGIINNDADLSDVVSAYDRYAAGISVLTDELYFGGTNDDLLIARNIASVPLLRKDFIIDEYQLHEAKGIGADVILLIAANLTKPEVKRLASKAKVLGLEVLLEIHNEEELDHICAEVDFVGVNNRNLKTFEVDINTSLKLLPQIPADKLAIAESGISNVDTIVTLRNAGFKGFLIGENFMKENDPAMAFKKFVQELKQKT